MFGYSDGDCIVIKTINERTKGQKFSSTFCFDSFLFDCFTGRSSFLKCIILAFGLTSYFSYLQVDLSPNGKEMMRNFLYDICGLSGTFTIKDRQEKCLQDIIETVGDNKVLVRAHSKMTSRKATNLCEISHPFV